MQQPSFRPRPGGGFNQGLGQFGEHLDEQALLQAAQQKALSQQSSSVSQTPVAQNPTDTAAPEPQSAGGPSLFDTLITAPMEAIGKTFLSLLGLDKLLGIDTSAPQTPEERAKKQTLLRRYNQLDDEQQAVARTRYQQRLRREQMLQQEEERRRQFEAQKDEAPLQAQSKPQSGAQGPGGQRSKKQQMLSKLQQDRKTLSGPQSAG